MTSLTLEPSSLESQFIVTAQKHNSSLKYEVWDSVSLVAPTHQDYRNALRNDGASSEFAQLFADRITSTGAEHEVDGS